MARLELPGSAGLAEALRGVPASPGVAQLLGEGDRSLLVGRPADLRRWARSQLGLGRPRRGRPATDLSGVARILLWFVTTSGFEQRLRCERLLAHCVPESERRDLPAPFWLWLDLDDRFPRLVTSPRPSERGSSWGVFRGRDAARAARDQLNRQFALRPCEEDFEPAPDLALGLGCLYGQVRSCSAPCLERVGQAAYADLARRAAAFLSAPAARPGESVAWLPAAIASHDARGVVAERLADGFALWPVRAGRVGDGVSAPSAGQALADLRWPDPGGEPRDAAWLVDWISERRRSGVYRILEEQEPLAMVTAGLEKAADSRPDPGTAESTW
jgi:hypothetical protein